jgi:hypothetical protein
VVTPPRLTHLIFFYRNWSSLRRMSKTSCWAQSLCSHSSWPLWASSISTSTLPKCLWETLTATSLGWQWQ